MNLGLAGKRVVVTGGSRGIGRAIATAMLAEGVRIAICARSQPGLDDAQSALSEQGEVHARTCDLFDHGQIREFVDWANGQLGGVDILISNVSAGGNDFRKSVEVDIMGAQTLMRAALPHMADDSGANIVCISSRAASIGIPFLQAYAAAKAATVSMVKSLALEVAGRGIRVNAVSPGDIEFEGGAWAKVRKERPELFASVLADNPLGRLGTPEEVADFVTFVASERASFVTGANLLVDGGATKSVQI